MVVYGQRIAQRRGTLLFLALVYVCHASGQDTANDESFPALGEPIRQAIDKYDHLNIFSSTRLLPRRLVVQSLPDRNLPPSEQIKQLLDPFDLVLIMTGQETGYVTIRTTSEPSHDEDNAKQRSVAQSYMEEIVVYAPVRVDRTDRRQSLQQQRLNQIPSLGRDTLRTLQTLPGVSADGVSALHSIRGGDTNEVLYRLDGIDRFKPFHFADVNSLFSAVNPNIVDSVDVYLSGFPSRFGTRMTGVVDMHLMEPERPIQGTLDLGLVSASADARGYSGNWSWLVSGRMSLIGDVLNRTAVSSEENLAIPRFDDELLHLRWSGLSDEFVLGVYRSGETLDVERESIGERANSEVDQFDVWMRWSRDFGSDLRTTWQSTHFDITRTRNGTNEVGEEARGSLHVNRESTITSLSSQWRWTPDRDTELNVGWSYLRHDAEVAASLTARYGALGLPIQQVDSEARYLIFDRTGPSKHVFASITRSLTSRLTGTVGSRFDQHEVAEVDSREFSGRLAFSYRITPAWEVDLDVGRYLQPQFLHEIQIDEGRTELDPPQVADQINVGIDWASTNRLTVSADVYKRRIHQPWSRFDNLYNRFTLLPELGSDRYLIEADSARSKGIELAAVFTSDDFNWKLAHSRLISKERVNGRWYRRSWDQPYTLKVQFTWKHNAWRFGGNLTYRSGWPITPLVREATQLPTILNEERLPHFISLDLHCGRTIELSNSVLEIYGDVTNATNRRNLTGYIYDSEFNRKDGLSLPIVPSIGVRWSF